MPKYKVEVCVDGSMTFVVEARDKEEAENIACDKAWKLVDDTTFIMSFPANEVE